MRSSGRVRVPCTHLRDELAHESRQLVTVGAVRFAHRARTDSADEPESRGPEHLERRDASEGIEIRELFATHGAGPAHECRHRAGVWAGDNGGRGARAARRVRAWAQHPKVEHARSHLRGSLTAQHLGRDFGHHAVA